MEEDEVVNCLCHHPEGDGMMVQVVPLQKLESGSIKFRYLEILQSSVQCEVCLTWQHGACIGVDCEEQVISADIQGGFFNWSALKMIKCQTLRKF